MLEEVFERGFGNITFEMTFRRVTGDKVDFVVGQMFTQTPYQQRESRSIDCVRIAGALVGFHPDPILAQHVPYNDERTSGPHVVSGTRECAVAIPVKANCVVGTLQGSGS